MGFPNVVETLPLRDWKRLHAFSPNFIMWPKGIILNLTVFTNCQTAQEVTTKNLKVMKEGKIG